MIRHDIPAVSCPTLCALARCLLSFPCRFSRCYLLSFSVYSAGLPRRPLLWGHPFPIMTGVGPRQQWMLRCQSSSDPPARLCRGETHSGASLALSPLLPGRFPARFASSYLLHSLTSFASFVHLFPFPYAFSQPSHPSLISYAPVLCLFVLYYSSLFQHCPLLFLFAFSVLVPSPPVWSCCLCLYACFLSACTFSTCCSCTVRVSVVLSRNVIRVAPGQACPGATHSGYRILPKTQYLRCSD